MRQGYGYDVSALTRLIMTMFERYSDLLQRKYCADFDQVWRDPVLLLKSGLKSFRPVDCYGRRQSADVCQGPSRV